MDEQKKHKTKQALKESEKRYRELFESAPISIWEEDFSEVKKYLDDLKSTGVKDLEKYFDDHPAEIVKCTSMVKILDVNQNTLNLYKATSKKELAKGLDDVFTIDSLSTFKKEILHLHGGFTNFHTEAVTKTLAGNHIDIFLKLNIMPGHEDSWSRILVTIIDITDHMKSRKALKESEQKYKDLFENSPDPIIIANMDGIIVDCNSVTETVFGYKKQEFLENGIPQISSLISGILKPIQESNNDKDIINQNFSIQETKIDSFYGDSVWVKIQPSITKIGGSYFIYIIFQNITEIKQSEREKLILEQTLEELDALIETAPLAILFLHQSGRILRVNEELKSLLEYQSEELLNINIFQLFETSSFNTVKQFFEKGIYDLLKSKKFEAQIKTKSGKILDIEVTSTILRMSGNIIIQSFFSDISEQKRYEKNLQQLSDKLLSSLEFKSKFLATMSHELRTPLNSLLGFSELLLMESYGSLNPKQREFLSDIKSGGEHLLSLIDSILDISKIEVGKFKLSLRKTKLQYLIEAVKTLIHPLYRKKNLGFLIEGIKQQDFLIVDQMHFKRILYNLLSNAIKFSKKGMIMLKAIERTDHWEFQVTDMGIGIAKQDFEIVFREFGRIENDRIKEIPGTGLGLSLTKRLVNLHGGDIWFESELGKGTTFFFTIPKRKEFPEASKTRVMI